MFIYIFICIGKNENDFLINKTLLSLKADLFAHTTYLFNEFLRIYSPIRQVNKIIG